MVGTWLYRAILLIVLQLPQFRNQLVPHSGATRFIPNWWMAVQAAGVCWTSDDCPRDECCVRPTGSQHRFCLPMRQLGEACRFRQTLADASHSVYLNLCPCAKELVCREIFTGWVDAECVSPRNPADLLRDSFRHAILKAIQHQKEQKRWQKKLKVTSSSINPSN